MNAVLVVSALFIFVYVNKRVRFWLFRLRYNNVVSCSVPTLIRRLQIHLYIILSIYKLVIHDYTVTIIASSCDLSIEL